MTMENAIEGLTDICMVICVLNWHARHRGRLTLLQYVIFANKAPFQKEEKKKISGCILHAHFMALHFVYIKWSLFLVVVD